MNYKEKIEEKIMQYSKELLTIRDTHNVPWLINECTKASNVLAEELTALYEQAQRDAVEDWMDYLFKEHGEWVELDEARYKNALGQYLNQTERNVDFEEPNVNKLTESDGE
jgi:hypothetical protein